MYHTCFLTEKLRRTFEDFNFKVIIHRDLIAAEIKKELKACARDDHSAYNAFVCCLLSHGNKGIILAKDGKSVELSKIIGKQGILYGGEGYQEVQLELVTKSFHYSIMWSDEP